MAMKIDRIESCWEWIDLCETADWMSNDAEYVGLITGIALLGAIGRKKKTKLCNLVLAQLVADTWVVPTVPAYSKQAGLVFQSQKTRLITCWSVCACVFNCT